MTRPNKQTVDYFPHNCNHGRTMFILEQKYGNDGYAFWFKLLELLGSTDGHFLDLNDGVTKEFLVAKTKINAVLCDEILSLLASIDAIDKELWENSIIWSQNLVNNISSVYKKRQAGTPTKPSFRCQKPRLGVVPVVGNPQNTGVGTVSGVGNPQSIVEDTRESRENIVNDNSVITDGVVNISDKKAALKAEHKTRDDLVSKFFEEFWEFYPRKEAKKDAEKAFRKIFPYNVSDEQCTVRLQNLGACVTALKREGRERKHIPLPATLLNREDFDVPFVIEDDCEGEWVDVVEGVGNEH